jgi:hypothetical protein
MASGSSTCPVFTIKALILPSADPHDLPQTAMVLGEILQFVIIEITAEPNGRQHRDLPVVHAASAVLATGVAIDVLAHQGQQFAPQLAIAINMLQGPKNGHDLIPAFEIQPHFADGQTIQALLRARQTHGFPP